MTVGHEAFRPQECRHDRRARFLRKTVVKLLGTVETNRILEDSIEFLHSRITAERPLDHVALLLLQQTNSTLDAFAVERAILMAPQHRRNLDEGTGLFKLLIHPVCSLSHCVNSCRQSRNLLPNLLWLSRAIYPWITKNRPPGGKIEDRIGSFETTSMAT